jgi:aspartyl-tRNA(Asn)/glutamyl-tRNA(Gln) amidotransferase subunit A
VATNELVFKSARELGSLIKSKQVSPVEVVQACLDRIDDLNPKLNTFITITKDEALQRARQAEKEIRGGKYLGMLHGIPYAPKDIFATKGIRTTNGSKVTADWIPDYESTVTDRLNKAGAILLGKLNLSEFATGSSVLSGFGPVRNPWHTDYSPAGSSSGSGAALAAHLVPLATGTDTGGSIRGPAAANGVVGLKPTYGRVSRYGVTTLSWTLDHAGPMTRTVADNAMMLQVMAGADPKDSSCKPEPVPDYSKALTGNIKGLRIGVPSFYFEGVQPEVEKTVRAAIQTLADMGAIVKEVELPHAKYAGTVQLTVAIAEAAAFHEKRLREKAHLLDPVAREYWETANFIPATDYIKAMRARTLIMQEMADAFTKCDVMAVPANAGLPNKIESPETAKSTIKPGSKSEPIRRGSTALGNVTGLPAIVIPCGFSTTQPVFPITIQFYGKPFDEFTLFRVSHAYESSSDWHKRRPPLQT